MIGVKTKFNFLDERSASDIIWQGVNAIPCENTLSSAMAKLSPRVKSHVLFCWAQKKRSFTDTLRWANSYAEDCYENLVDTFISPTKKIEVLLLVDITNTELNLIFRLSTVGKEGWTGFSIAWIKTTENSFLCSS